MRRAIAMLRTSRARPPYHEAAGSGKENIDMHTDIYREISRDVPRDERIIKGGEPLFTAYGCVLLERGVVDKYYVYTAVNVTTGDREVVSRLVNPLTTSGVKAMAEKIRLSKVAGAGRLQADRDFGASIPIKNCRDMVVEIFREILPEKGYAIRQEQIELAVHILETLYRRQITLAEAEVGIGKTLAYLIAAVIAKRGRINGYWNMSFYTGSAYIEMAHMPIVITTSSIALQKALMTAFIPELSDILMDYGVITAPLTAVIRKGREHYVCEQRLRAHMQIENDEKIMKLLEGLLKPNAKIDLAEIDGMTPYIKRRISVPDRCGKRCPHRDKCMYLRFFSDAQSPEIDIQVCNHNYLLADTLRRKKGQRPLIPNYQSLIIDEAHKFLAAARSMYGVELSDSAVPEVKGLIYRLNFKSLITEKTARKLALRMTTQNTRLFRSLNENAKAYDDEDEPVRYIAAVDVAATRRLRSICDIAGSLTELLSEAPVDGNGEGRKAQILWELKQLRVQTSALSRNEGLICWLEDGDGGHRLCAIPKDLDKQLYGDLWSKGIPTILTSGTLSSGAGQGAKKDFTRIKRALGLDYAGNRLTDTSKASPFNHRENALLYISENMPFPDQGDREYISAVADEVERLIRASHGHAAVLFTSYNAMGQVYVKLKKRKLPFPLFRLDKGGVRAIEKFKESGNGVLFASGAMWEGIDIPGDALSMLIIVKLPFQAPDPIGEYEQTLYRDMDEYKWSVIVPEMLIKLKQGFGRLIRTERDSGVVAILDCRAAINGAYRKHVLGVLPSCFITCDIGDLIRFFEQVKQPEYFI